MSNENPYPDYGNAPQPNYGAPGAAKPDNNLVWGILTTILCCLPLGIVSIVKATKVDGLWAQGDFAGAQAAADDAKKWAMYAVGAGVVYLILMVILMIAGVFAI